MAIHLPPYNMNKLTTLKGHFYAVADHGTGWLTVSGALDAYFLSYLLTDKKITQNLHNHCEIGIKAVR